ncbi:MAG: hypothetical protein ACE5Q6_08215 [Dehalococcoidia bacterium]
MKLGIVGHAQEKFTLQTQIAAHGRILDAVKKHQPTHIVSGRSPMGGVDIYAETIASTLSIPTIIHAPKRNTWSAPGGFKERNLAIARDSDLVLVVVVAEYPEGYTGMRFKDCYHCKGRNPPHIKSGGCWTAWQCPRHEWVIIR